MKECADQPPRPRRRRPHSPVALFSRERCLDSESGGSLALFSDMNRSEADVKMEVVPLLNS